MVAYFLRLGATGFGGPIALVESMRRDLVERRGWVAPDGFSRSLALSQLAPGPLAAQVAVCLGYLDLWPHLGVKATWASRARAHRSAYDVRIVQSGIYDRVRQAPGFTTELRRLLDAAWPRVVEQRQRLEEGDSMSPLALAVPRRTTRHWGS